MRTIAASLGAVVARAEAAQANVVDVVLAGGGALVEMMPAR
jgi:hypothetical protein